MAKLLRDMTEPELKHLMRSLASAIEEVAEVLGVEKPRFALLMFNDPEIAQYICNCRREDVIKSMRECADRLEARDDVTRVPFPRR